MDGKRVLRKSILLSCLDAAVAAADDDDINCGVKNENTFDTL